MSREALAGMVGKRVELLTTLTVAAGVLCGAVHAAPRFVPPSKPETPAKPSSPAPDPFGLTLAGAGMAAAVGYVMRRRRGG